MSLKRYQIQFSKENLDHLGQDEVYFFLKDKNDFEKILFHDYEKIYSYPGLYEQLFYERLKCNSPQIVCEDLRKTVDTNKEHFSELKILDFGAGNGIMGEVLKNIGVARLVGVDIIREAEIAAERDRPGVYDDFFVKDFTKLRQDEREEIKSWNLNTLTTVAALGFGDIPPKAFIEAVNLIDENGWVAFNIKESFLTNSDNSGFSKLIRELIFSEYLSICMLERYRHRVSAEGIPLYYFSVVCKKHRNVDFNILSHEN